MEVNYSVLREEFALAVAERQVEEKFFKEVELCVLPCVLKLVVLLQYLHRRKSYKKRFGTEDAPISERWGLALFSLRRLKHQFVDYSKESLVIAGVLCKECSVKIGVQRKAEFGVTLTVLEDVLPYYHKKAPYALGVQMLLETRNNLIALGYDQAMSLHNSPKTFLQIYQPKDDFDQKEALEKRDLRRLHCLIEFVSSHLFKVSSLLPLGEPRNTTPQSTP